MSSFGRRSSSDLIKHWSLTQKAVTLSSAEAELCGVVRSKTETLGTKCRLRLWPDHDPERAHSIRSRHWDLQESWNRAGWTPPWGQLWVKLGLRQGDFRLFRVRGDANPADALTNTFRGMSWTVWSDEQSRRRRRSCSSSMKTWPRVCSSASVAQYATTLLELSIVCTRSLSTPILAALAMI